MMDSQYKKNQKNEIQRTLLDLIYRIDPTHSSKVPSDEIFSYELGLDSIAKIELAGAIQRDFGIQLADDEIASSNTLDDLAETIARKQKHSRSHTTKSSEYSSPGNNEFSFKESRISRLIRAPFYRSLDGLMHHYFELEVQGKENIPPNGTFILAANHSSHLDNLSLMLACGFPFNDFVLMAAKDYFFERKTIKLQLLKYFFNLAPFDRTAEPSAMQNNINWCKACIKQHKNLIIFPEATRSVNGILQPFKGGCALLAYELNLPILPAYIEGAYDCLPKGKVWPKKGRITVSFAKPLFMDHYKNPVSEVKYQIYKQITKDLEQQIRELGRI